MSKRKDLKSGFSKRVEVTKADLHVTRVAENDAGLRCAFVVAVLTTDNRVALIQRFS